MNRDVDRARENGQASDTPPREEPDAGQPGAHEVLDVYAEDLCELFPSEYAEDASPSYVKAVAPPAETIFVLVDEMGQRRPVPRRTPTRAVRSPVATVVRRLRHLRRRAEREALRAIRPARGSRRLILVAEGLMLLTVANVCAAALVLSGVWRVAPEAADTVALSGIAGDIALPAAAAPAAPGAASTARVVSAPDVAGGGERTASRVRTTPPATGAAARRTAVPQATTPARITRAPRTGARPEPDSRAPQARPAARPIAQSKPVPSVAAPVRSTAAASRPAPSAVPPAASAAVPPPASAVTAMPVVRVEEPPVVLAAAVASAAIAADTPAPARTAPPEPAARSNSAAIQDVLNQYRDAFNTLDPEAARTVWPSADAKALGRAFASLEEQGLVLQTCRIDVNGARAVALCGGTLRYVPKHGNKTARVEQRQWEFTLREVAERWSIDSVDAR